MATFVNPEAGRETVNLLGAGVFDLQLFGDNPFGIPESSEEPSEKPSEKPAEESTPAEPQTQAPQQAVQAPAQGEPAKSQAGEPDKLAKFRKADGSLDTDKLISSYLNLESGYGKLNNDVGTLRQQLTQLQQAAPAQGEPPAEIDWDALNTRFMEEFSQNPFRTFLNYMALYGGQALAPFQQYIAQQEAKEYVMSEAANWWGSHANLPDDVIEAMQREYDTYQEILEAPNPQDPTRPLLSPTKALDLLLRVAQGQAAPQAIQQAAEAAAQAAVQGQADKLGAQAGTGTKAPTTTEGDPVLSGLKTAAKEVHNPFGM